MNYEFVRVNENKSHLLMNSTYLEKLGAETFSFRKVMGEKNNCKDVVCSIKLIA